MNDNLTPTTETSPQLQGPRQLGIVEGPNGPLQSHEITADGMKQTRYIGERYKNVNDFHRQAGVAQPYQLEDAGATPVEAGSPKPEGVMKRTAKTVGKALLDAASLAPRPKQ